MSAYKKKVEETAGLINYWPLTENSGTAVKGGVNATMTSTSSVAKNSGPLEKGDEGATGYNGTSSTTQTGELNLESQTGGITTEFWINWTTNGTNDDFAMEFGANANSSKGWNFDWNNSTAGETNTVSLKINYSTTGQDRRYTFPRPTAGSWHHVVVFLKQNTTPVVYIDGASAMVTPREALNNQTNTNFGKAKLNLMCRNASSLFGEGKMSHVALYSGELSKATIELHYAAAKEEELQAAYVRSFNGADRVRTSVGSSGSIKASAFTLAAIINPESIAAGTRTIFNPFASSGASPQFFQTEGKIGIYDDGTTKESTWSASLAVGTWVLVAVTKASGSVKPKFYKVVLSSKALTSGEGSIEMANLSLEPTEVRIGEYNTSEYFSGRISACAIWAEVLTESQIKGLGESSSVEAWKSIGKPKDLWTLGQSSVEEEVKDLIGTANQTSRTATATVAEKPPIPYKEGEKSQEVEFNFESGTLNGFNTSGVGEGPIEPAISTAIAHSGIYSVIVNIPSNSKQNRAELSFGGNGGTAFTSVQFHNGDHYKYSFWHYIFPGELAYGLPGAHNIFTQLKSSGEGSPLWALELWNWQSPEGSGTYKKGLWVAGNEANTYAAPYAEGQWHHVEVEFITSETTSGLFRVTLDGSQVWNSENVQTVETGHTYAYLKTGNYRNGEKVSTAEKPVFNEGKGGPAHDAFDDIGLLQVVGGAKVIEGKVSLSATSSLTAKSIRQTSTKVSLSASSSSVVKGIKVATSKVSLSTASSQSIVGTRIAVAKISLTATSSISVTKLQLTRLGKSALSATSSQIIKGQRIPTAKIALIAASSLTVKGTKVRTDVASLSAISELKASGIKIVNGKANLSATAILIASAEGNHQVSGNAHLNASSELRAGGITIHTGRAPLSSLSGMTVKGVRIASTKASLGASAVLSVRGIRIGAGRASMTSQGALKASGVRISIGNVPMAAVTTLAVKGFRIVSTQGSLQASSQLVGVGHIVKLGSSSFHAVSMLDANGSVTTFAIVALTAQSILKATGKVEEAFERHKNEPVVFTISDSYTAILSATERHCVITTDPSDDRLHLTVQSFDTTKKIGDTDVIHSAYDDLIEASI